MAASIVRLTVPFTEQDVQRFQKYLRRDEDTGCLVWTGALNAAGYGQFRLSRETWLSHRIAWLFSGQPIPADRPHVLHRCDNPPCCEVEHLWCGTHEENIKDRDNKRRSKKSSLGYPRGVSPAHHGEGWAANLYYADKMHYLWTYGTPEEASAAVEAARALSVLLPHLFAAPIVPNSTRRRLQGPHSRGGLRLDLLRHSSQ